MSALAFLALAVLLLFLALRWYTTVPAADLAQAVRTFIAVFSALASTGLVFAGRFGLALVTLAAFVTAVRSYLRARRPADPLEHGSEKDRRTRVRTRHLEMELDRRTGRLDGRVCEGPDAGRRLSEMAVSELVALLSELAREDPEGARLLEAYLDRRDAGWRSGRSSAGDRHGGKSRTADMDVETARAILGVDASAGPEEIKAAHRRLMARLHPDHGGSNYLASQINRAKEVLLGGRP